jgi:hypothetical protein
MASLKINAQVIKTTYQLALLGLSEVSIAQVLDVDQSTITDWKNKFPKFKKALLNGRELASGKVADALFKKATGYDYDEVTHERQAVVVTGPDGLAVIDPVTKEPVIEYRLIETKRVKKHVAISEGAALGFLKNKNPDLWKDKQEIDHTSKGKALGTVPVIHIINPHEADEASVRHSDES